jgi:16S rRNA (cytidine1402-2'-O)-methyltransferase
MASLTVVATPIGNLDDITVRALSVLRNVDEVLAEDTRTTLALLRAHDIERPITRLDENTIRARATSIVDRMREGRHYALVSDAGTPLVSDPGDALVRATLDAGLLVEATPGASAVLVALVVSGLGGGGFRFVGFVPREGTARRTALATMARDPLATVFFEGPERVVDTLEALAAVCEPTRRVVVARELTKLHETCLRGSITEVLTQTREGVRGEVTVVLEGAPDAHDDARDDVDRALDTAIAAGMKPSDAAREVARALGLKRSDVYARVLERAR